MEQLVLSLEHPGLNTRLDCISPENARVTRDLIPKDAWIALNELHGLIERQSFAGLIDPPGPVAQASDLELSALAWVPDSRVRREIWALYFCVLVIVWNMPIWCPVWSIRASHRWFLVCPPAGAAMSPLGGKIYCQLSAVSSYTVTVPQSNAWY